MKKWKNKDLSSLPKSFLERTMFLKMQNFSGCGFLIISTSENRKKCQQNFTKNLHSLAIFHENCLSKGDLKCKIWNRRTYQVYPVTTWAMKTFVVGWLVHYWCKSGRFDVKNSVQCLKDFIRSQIDYAHIDPHCRDFLSFPNSNSIYMAFSDVSFTING